MCASLAVFMLLMACSSTHAPESTTASTTVHGGSPTTTLAAVPSTTTTAVVAPDNPFTAAQLAQALLLVGDLPTGFRVGPASQTSALTSICDKAPLIAVIPSSSQADIVFVHPDGTTISERLSAFRNNRVAQAFMEALRTEADCSSFVTVTPPSIGEQIDQWRFPSSIGTGHVLWLSQGSLVLQVCATGRTATDSLTANLASLALTRLKQALA